MRIECASNAHSMSSVDRPLVTYTPFTLGPRTVLRVDVNADGSVPNRSVPPRTGPPRGASLHRSVTVPFDSYWVCVKL